MQEENKENLSNFALRLKSLMEKRGIRPVDVARALNVQSGNVSGWRGGDYYPKTELRPRLAEMLGVSETFLIHGKPERPSDNLEGYPDSLDRSETIQEHRTDKTMDPYPMIAPLRQGDEPDDRPVTRADCERYFAQFLDEAEKQQSRLGWTYEELLAHFPLNKWREK